MSYQNEQDYTNEKVDPKLWKRLYAYAWRNKRIFIMTIACLLFVALADSLYPLLTNYAVDRFIIPGKSDGTWLFLLVYILLAFSQGFGTLGFITRCGRMEISISYDIRQDGFLKLQNQSFSYFDKTAVGYLMARMVSDVSRLSEMVAWSMVDLLWSSCYAIMCLIIMLLKNWKLALLVLLVVPPLAVAALFLERAILKYQRAARKHNSRITGAFNEGIMGAMTTKTLVYEEENAREFREITKSMRKASIKAALINAVFFPLVISLGAIGTSLALFLGGQGVLDPEHAFIGPISAGTLVAFVTYAASLFDPIQQIASIFADFQSAQASAERVIGLIDAPIEIQDTPEVMEKYGDVIHPKRENWEPILGHIRFEHVNFAYNPEEPVLTDFNLDIQAGQTIALVGETGAGKSTIVNLICRFYEPTAGAIYIDGKDYRTRSQLWLQSSLGYVLQSPHLFSGTIADNIRYGRPDATLEEVKEAARLVHAEQFILEQAKGYDTEVGEGGIRLSTGQKQLICFARVILADPRIFVLDEATSSIDTETEQLIQDAITTVLKGRTSLVVAHRLSTIRNADRILVIRGGQIQESGTHEELIALGGYYHDLYEHQFREERLHSAMKDAGME
ncbi:MAG: ABC transporter ATP-binding protein [Clostridia bacterium]|nr:ABC transporter ATP-binding protein [Clostridia bacterium]